ncbi:TP901 family phage tail tape measure protein [Thalassospira sp. 11-3]|nr:TP901 family phage tail tape measure protein [Thalassospira sp. 11-3]
MGATIKIPAEFRAIDKFSGVIKAMTRGVRNFSNNGIAAVRRFDMRVQRTFSKLNRMVGNFGVLMGGAAIVGAIGGAISITADYEQANANLAAVMGKTVEQTQALQADSKLLGSITKFTSAEVTGLQTEYAKLGFVEDEILKVTKGTLALAAATGTDLDQAAAQVGATIRAFGYDAKEAARVSDAFAASTSKSALNMEFLNTAMSIVAPVASKFGFEVEGVLALLGNLADSGFDASSAATATRNILLNLADANGKLAKSLGKPVKDLPSLVAGLKKLDAQGVNLAKMLELTDVRSVAAFSTFVKGTDKILDLNDALNVAGGSAQAMADKQLATLTGKTTILRSAYEGFILSLDNGKGPYSQTIKNVVDTATEMLSMASGTAKAATEMSEGELKIRAYAEAGIKAVKVIGGLTAAYLAFKVGLMAYNVAMGVYTVSTQIATAATTAFGVALNLGLWPILAIIAGIAAIIAIFYYWDEITAWFGKQWTTFTGMLGAVWDNLVKWFKNFSFKDFFKSIGQSLMKYLLWPMKQLLTLLSKLPGKVGKMASMGLDKIGEMSGELDVNDSRKPLDGPEVNNANITKETVTRNSLAIDINDPGNNVKNTRSEGPLAIPVKVSNTQGNN